MKPSSTRDAVSVDDGAPAPTAIRLLVIDDDEVLRQALAQVLTSVGYQVTTAGSGAEGLRRFAEGHHDVVLSDVRMPGPDGWQVARAVRTAVPETGIVLLSGEFDRLPPPRAAALGIITLAKPVAFEDLVEAIDRARPRRRRLPVRDRSAAVACTAQVVRSA